MQRDEFAVAVTGGRVGAHPEASQQLEHRRFHQAEGRLGGVGGGQRSGRGGALVGIEGRRRHDARGELGLGRQRLQ